MTNKLFVRCLILLTAILITRLGALPLAAAPVTTGSDAKAHTLIPAASQTSAQLQKHQSEQDPIATQVATRTLPLTPRWLNEQNKPPLLPPHFVALPGRTFQMGRTSGDGDDDEIPVHNVTLSPYAICKYEVTQAEWQAVMGTNPAHDHGVGPEFPVYNVSWYDIIRYCNLRSMAEGYTPAYRINGSTNPLNWGVTPTYDSPAWNAVVCNWDADGYRLPTDAEWEFAARGGTNSPDYMFSGSNNINLVAWNDGNATVPGCKPVGSKAPNSLGIHDMSGNLWEYCWDWRDDFTGEDEVDPTGPINGFLRLARGGYWLNLPQQCRVYERSGYYAFEGSYWMGFRVARSLPD